MKRLFVAFAIFYSFSCFAQDQVKVPDEEYEKAKQTIETKLAQDKIETEAKAAAIKGDRKALETAAAEERKQDVASELAKWNLGFGIGVEQYRDPYIESASLNGTSHIVTLDEQYRTRPSAWLTTNWPFNWENHKNWGFFVGVKIIDGNGEAFSAFALGPQYTFLTEDLKKISVGLGWVTHGTKRLANGIKVGEALPSQYDEIKYVKSTENSVMLMFTIGI